MPGLHPTSGGDADQRSPRPKWVVGLAALLGVGLVAGAIALGVVYGGRGDVSKAHNVAPVSIETQSVTKPVGLDTVLADLTREKPVAAGGSSTVGPDTNATEKPNVPTILMDEKFSGIFNTASGGKAAGESLLGAAAALSAASNSGNVEGTCRVANEAELRTAVTELSCPVVILTSTARDAYVLEEEIVVRRSVVIMGNSITLPFIDCAEAVRGFRVVAGGYLELQFVRVNIGAGEVRNRIGIFRDRKERKAQEVPVDEEDEEGYEQVWREMTEEDLAALSPEERVARKLQLGGQGSEVDPLQVIEIRGGTVLFEPGAVGGSFTGVYFTSDQTDFEDVMVAVSQTLNLNGIRIWGGHVLVSSGTVTFNGCIFYDLEILTPLSDRIYFGGDVLILAGTAYFTGCAWFYTTVIGMENGMGFNVAMFGGASIFTACHFQEQNAAAVYNGVGQAFLVLGGVQIITGCNFIYFSALELFTGTGELTVLGGVQVATGVSWEEYYGCFAYYGAGLDYAVMAGVMVLTGATLNQFSGPIWGSVAGDYVFVGAGAFTAHGFPIAQYQSIGGETGSGGLVYVATGSAVFVGGTVFDVSGIWTTFAIGEYIGVSSGFMVIVGFPFTEVAGLEYFQGLGGTVYLGAGAAVMGYSPHNEMIAWHNEHIDFWIMGSCEPEHHAWAPGKLFFIPPGLGNCEPHDHDHDDEDHEDHDEHEDRRQLQRQRQSHAQRLLAALGQQDLVLAANMSKTRLRLDDPVQAQYLRALNTPAAVFEAARGVQSLRSALGIVEAEASPDAPPYIYIHGQREGFCGLCGVDSVGGPGAASCDIQESCSNLKTPFNKAVDDGVELATAADLADYATLNYREHFVVTADLDTLLPASSSSDAADIAPLTPADVEAAVRDALAGEEGAADPLDVVQVTVHDAQADPMLKAHFPDYYPDLHDQELDAFHRRMAAGPADIAQRFKVSVVATSRADQNRILTAMTPGPKEADGRSALEVALVENLGFDKDIEVGATRLSVDKTLYVPAYNSKSLFATDASKPMGAFTVSLVDPEQPSIPVTEANYGTRYVVSLDNFPPNSVVSVKVFRRQLAAKGATEFDPSWVVDQALQVDEAGKAQVFYTFQQPLLPLGQQLPGDYYLKATDAASGIYNFSPLFALSSEQRRRKLYGPVMWA